MADAIERAGVEAFAGDFGFSIGMLFGLDISLSGKLKSRDRL